MILDQNGETISWIPKKRICALVLSLFGVGNIPLLPRRAIAAHMVKYDSCDVWW